MTEEETPMETQDMKQYYVLGIVVLVAVVIAGYILRSKSNKSATAPTEVGQVVVTPTPGPITKLGCDTQYFNPKIGFPEYYFSVEGADLSNASSVDCTISASQSGKIVATSKVTSPMTDKPERGGKTFRCTTKAIALTPQLETVIEVELKDDLGVTASCSAPFVMPAP